MASKSIIQNAVMPARQSTHFPLECLSVSKKNEDGLYEGPSIFAGKHNEDLVGKVNQAIIAYKKKNPGTNFSQRKCPDGNIRIWRTA